MHVHGLGFSPGVPGGGQGIEHKRVSVSAAPEETNDALATESAKLRPAHGVLRLLQEGHFKGVADVRLRINFADELAALQADATGASAQDGADGILDPVDSVLEEFLGQEGLDEELKGEIEDAAKAFRDAVNGLFSDFDRKADTKGEGLAVAIEDAFQAFVDALQALIPEESVPEETAPVDETVSGTEEVAAAVDAEVPAVDDFGFGEFIDRLGEVFADAIADLRESFQSAQILPELSEPHGNGGAYAKFLEILNGLTGGGGNAASSGVDTAA